MELQKSARPPARGGVYPNHLIQVLAYIVLVREHYGEQVPYGLVLYGNEEARKVYPTSENIAWLEGIITEVKRARGASTVNLSHQQYSRCRGCGMRQAATSRSSDLFGSLESEMKAENRYRSFCAQHTTVKFPQRRLPVLNTSDHASLRTLIHRAITINLLHCSGLS